MSEEAAAPKPETKRTIRTFAVASFLNDMGSDIINPVWPLFVTQVLKANMSALGFLDGLGEAIVSLSQAFAGYYSDRIRKRKVFIWTGYLCGAVSRLGYAASSLWQHLIPFRILDRAGKIRGAPRDAMLADVSTDANRGRHFGLLRAMDNAGSVAGILISIALIDVLGYRLLFALAAIPSLVGALLILKNIREAGSPRGPRLQGSVLQGRRQEPGSLHRPQRRLRPRRLHLFLPAPVRQVAGLQDRDDPHPLSRLLGRRPRFCPTPSGGFRTGSAASRSCSWPTGLGPLSAPGSLSSAAPAAVAALFVFYGIHKAALDPVQKTIAAELAPQPYRASVLGGFQMVIGFCALPASLVAGLLWDNR